MIMINAHDIYDEKGDDDDDDDDGDDDDDDDGDGNDDVDFGKRICCLIAAIWARGQRCRNAKICNMGCLS